MLERIMMRPERCKACHRCEIACIAAHHGLDLKTAMKRRQDFAPRVHVIKGENYKTTVRCHQCKSAPCVSICPTGALVQNEEGAISMLPELCMGCEMCMDACPYGVVDMDQAPFCAVEGGAPAEEENAPAVKHQVAVRCDLCREWRKANGKTMTACMEACPAQAIGLQQEDGTVFFPEKKAAARPAVKKTIPETAASESK